MSERLSRGQIEEIAHCLRSGLAVAPYEYENLCDTALSLYDENAALRATVDALKAERDQNAGVALAWQERAEAAEARVREFQEEISQAHVLLGEYGAGGTPAGTIGGIHNLAHRAEKAEAEVARLRAERNEAVRRYAEKCGIRYGRAPSAEQPRNLKISAWKPHVAPSAEQKP